MTSFLQLTITRDDGTARVADEVFHDTPLGRRLADGAAKRALLPSGVARVDVDLVTRISQGSKRVAS